MSWTQRSIVVRELCQSVSLRRAASVERTNLSFASNEREMSPAREDARLF